MSNPARLWPNKRGVEADVSLPEGKADQGIRRVEFGTPPDQAQPILRAVTNLSPDGMTWPLYSEPTLEEVQQLLAAVARTPETSYFAPDIKLFLRKFLGI